MVKNSIDNSQYRAGITSSFPPRFPSLLVYKVPMEDALPLSQSFSKLEEGKSKGRWLFEKVEHRLVIFSSISISPQPSRTSASRSTASL